MPDENKIVPTDVVEQPAAARPVLPHSGGPVLQAAGSAIAPPETHTPVPWPGRQDGPPHVGGQSLETEEGPPDLVTLTNQVNNLTQWVSSLTTTLAEFMEPYTVRGMGIPPNSQPETRNPRLSPVLPRLGGMWDSYDQVMAAYEQLMGLPVSQPVHRLTGIRELYMLLTGDRALTGRFQPDMALLTANTGFDPDGNVANTTAMAVATRNVMNKVLIDQVDLLAEYRWWERIAYVEDFNSLQQISWVRVGGVGDLPTVAEGGEYTQLAWDDARVTADFTKYGGYLPLTMEMIDKDDVAAWRSVPRQLATAAEVTLSGILSALFTDNSGVGPSITTEGNTAYAFSSTWGNLITQPLDWTNWCLAVETMYELAQLNVSGRAQAVRPRYLLVPIELEAQAITSVTSDQIPGSSNNDRTPTRRRLPEENVITVPDWTDAENWAAVADPRVCPFVGVGFRFGRNPELFTASDPNTHLMFTNDVLPVKVRWLFAVSVIDPRGAIKSNN
jgi:hypothetical protein